VETRFVRRTFPLQQPKVDVPDVLVAACVECDATVAIPAQSSPRLQEARREAARFEVRIPKELDDVLRLVSSKYSARHEVFGGSVIRYYLARMGEEPMTARRILRCAQSPIAAGRSDGRFSLRVEAPVWDTAWGAARRAGIRVKADVVRGAIVAAAVDAGLEVVEGMRSSPRDREALKAIASATATA
jgi:hypothetical protein